MVFVVVASFQEVLCEHTDASLKYNITNQNNSCRCSIFCSCVRAFVFLVNYVWTNVWMAQYPMYLCAGVPVNIHSFHSFILFGWKQHTLQQCQQQ